MTKNRKKFFLKLFIIFLILGSVLVILNIRVSSLQGVNYVIRTVRMPLYIKLIEFIDRDYHYRQTAKHIIKGCHSDKEKVLALFEWTHKNIKKNVPKDWRVVDDHVWHIIIRGYGEHDQSADVFTTLCVYAGIPAFWAFISPKNSRAKLTISYVRFNEKWRIFDSYHGNYFWSEKGKIASVEDIIGDLNLVSRGSNVQAFRGIDYIKYFENLSPITDIKFLRAKEQMPLPRLIYEIKKALNLM